MIHAPLFIQLIDRQNYIHLKGLDSVLLVCLQDRFEKRLFEHIFPLQLSISFYVSGK